MNFDEELIKLLEIKDHDELVQEYSFLCVDVDLHFQELESQQREKPDWWWIGLGFEKALSPRHQEEAKAIFRQFLKFKEIPGEDFFEMIDRFTQLKINGANKGEIR